MDIARQAVYLNVLLLAAWIVINLRWLPVQPFDPELVLLGTVASVEAIFLSAFVLISQNRMSTLENQRDELDLQVSLLTEHEITRLIELVSKIADRMGIDAASDPELAELVQRTAPEHVLDTMEETERKLDDAKD